MLIDNQELCSERTKCLEKCWKSHKQSKKKKKWAYENFVWFQGFRICFMDMNTGK